MAPKDLFNCDVEILAARGVRATAKISVEIVDAPLIANSVRADDEGLGRAGGAPLSSQLEPWVE